MEIVHKKHGAATISVVRLQEWDPMLFLHWEGHMPDPKIEVSEPRTYLSGSRVEQCLSVGYPWLQDICRELKTHVQFGRPAEDKYYDDLFTQKKWFKAEVQLRNVRKEETKRARITKAMADVERCVNDERDEYERIMLFKLEQEFNAINADSERNYWRAYYQNPNLWAWETKRVHKAQEKVGELQEKIDELRDYCDREDAELRKAQNAEVLDCLEETLPPGLREYLVDRLSKGEAFARTGLRL